MSDLRETVLALVNRIGQALPKRLQRRIADFPGVLGLLEKLSCKAVTEISTPEGHRLSINPLFHSNFIRLGSLDNYEPEIRNAIVQLTKPGMAAYDIGANIGVFSFLFSFIVNRDGIVYAFEPEKNNYTCLEESLTINNIQNITIDKRAIGKAKGINAFDRRGGAFSGRIIGQEATYRHTQNIEMVETISLDDLVNEEGYRVPDIIKVDVEGNEFMVLQGMANILACGNPIIICELHTHLGEDSKHVIELLTNYGYSLYAIRLPFVTSGNYSKLYDLSQESHIVAVKQTTPTESEGRARAR